MTAQKHQMPWQNFCRYPIGCEQLRANDERRENELKRYWLALALAVGLALGLGLALLRDTDE